MSPRRKPHCRKCFRPMEGHRRRDGAVLCPSVSDSLPTPPSSPSSSARSLPVGPFRPAVLPEITFPYNGYRPNPQWVEPLPNSAPQPSDEFEDDVEGSVVSTVLVDDGPSIQPEDDYDTASDDSDEVMESLRTSIPLASIFSTPKEDIAEVRQAAKDIGYHTSLMRSPSARLDGKSSVNRLGQRKNSWWVVMGRSAEAVRHLVNLEQCRTNKEIQMVVGDAPPVPLAEVQVVQALPVPQAEVVVDQAPSVPQAEVVVERAPLDLRAEVMVGHAPFSPAVLAFLQIVLAGAIGGIAVLLGMTRMM